MGDSTTNIPDMSGLKMNEESDAVTRADKQAELINRFVTIAEKIRPKLSMAGTNFNTWSCNMLEAWATVFISNVTYFDDTSQDPDYRRNLIALALIQHSVDRPLFHSIMSRLFIPNSRNVYQALKNCFNRASWSSIVHHANIIFNPVNQSLNITQHTLRLSKAIEAIENQIGVLYANKIMTLLLFFSMPHLQDQITSALDTRMAVNPSVTIYPEDILDIVWQISSQSLSAIIGESSHLARINTYCPPPAKGICPH
ncbi:hypothetical protein O181_076130 [Austropuccinia psidii MF-1]|uniref:Uncharacterized protein n=1 Tax=Austropuccinia psidii MF-1 TaxID=1389203 RepID=A0A9Q3F813_9BASI|nr:hypothetical protein [Austropuccinia psidii MF-1]